MTEIEYMRLNGWTWAEIAEFYGVRYYDLGVKHAGKEIEER